MNGDIEAGVAAVTGDGEQAATNDSPAPSPGLSLYHETLQAFLFSNLIMCLPPLRDWGRDGELRGDPDRLERFQRLPCTGADLCVIFQDNQELLTTQEGGLLRDESKFNLYQQALGLESAETSNVMFGNHSYHDIVQDLEIVVMSDYRQETDIVYMITVSHLLKQVAVIFRGSTTLKDYKQDFKVLLARIPNPIEANEQFMNREDELGMHLGFREYLYAEEAISKVLYKPKIFKTFLALLSSNRDKGDTDEAANKAAEQMAAQDPRVSGFTRKQQLRDLKKSLELPCKYQIIIEQVLDVIEEHSDYRLFCTGHSLGGSLAVAMAFEAAADERVPAPVTCVNSGALKVGSTTYLRAFTYLEKQGRLRCAQVSNNRDIIPKFPANGTLNIFAAACWSDMTFRHMGLQVEFLDKGKYIVHIPPPHENRFGMLVHDFVRMFRFWGVVALVIPGLMILSGATFFCFCFWPACAYCVLHHGKGFDVHHSQNKYMARLEVCREDMEQILIEDLYARRWKRPRYKLPRVHQYKATRKEGA